MNVAFYSSHKTLQFYDIYATCLCKFAAKLVLQTAIIRQFARKITKKCIFAQKR